MHIVGNDVTVWQINATTGGLMDCVAELNEIRINAERTMIDVSGIQIGSHQYPMAYYRVGELQLNITASQMLSDTTKLFNPCVLAEEVYVSFAWKPGGFPAGTGGQAIVNMYCYIVTDNVSFPGRSEKAGEEVSFRPSRALTFTELGGVLMAPSSGAAS